MVRDSRHSAFAADAPLGSLVRWLRILGFDTLCLRQAGRRPLKGPPDRIRLTRDSRLMKEDSGNHRIFITSDHLREQLRQVIETLALDPGDVSPFTRCLKCNTTLLPMEKSLLPGRVPPYIYQTQTNFRICPDCDRIYWPGSHSKAVRKMIDEIFGSARRHEFRSLKEKKEE